MTARTPELAVLAALDGLRDALGEYMAVTREAPAEPAALLTVADAARVLGVSRSTATRWLASGELPDREIDGRRWIARVDLDRIAASRP